MTSFSLGLATIADGSPEERRELTKLAMTIDIALNLRKVRVSL